MADTIDTPICPTTRHAEIQLRRRGVRRHLLSLLLAYGDTDRDVGGGRSARSCSSFAIADGASLHLVGKLLGHANSRSTERYAHIDRSVTRDAAASIARRIMPGVSTDTAEVIRLGATGR